jgi:hypothetical protein
MKKLSGVLSLFILFNLSTTNAQTISLGAGLIYGSAQEDLGVNGNLILHALPIIDIKGGYNYYFTEGYDNYFDDSDTGSAYSFDLDLHWVLLDLGFTRAYLLSGVNFATFSFDDFSGETISNTDTGFTLGAGGEFGIGTLLRGFAEAKYVTGNSSGVVVTLGLRIGV